MKVSDSADGENDEDSELRMHIYTRTDISPATLTVLPPLFQFPPSYRPPSFSQAERSIGSATGATRPENNTLQLEQPLSIERETHRTQIHLVYAPNSIPMPPPYSGTIGSVASSPTSPFKIRLNATGARLPEVNVLGFGVADEREPEVGPAPPEYSATPVPTEQPEFDSAEALPIAPPPSDRRIHSGF